MFLLTVTSMCCCADDSQISGPNPLGTLPNESQLTDTQVNTYIDSFVEEQEARKAKTGNEMGAGHETQGATQLDAEMEKSEPVPPDGGSRKNEDHKQGWVHWTCCVLIQIYFSMRACYGSYNICGHPGHLRTGVRKRPVLGASPCCKEATRLAASLSCNNQILYVKPSFI